MTRNLSAHLFYSLLISHCFPCLLGSSLYQEYVEKTEPETPDWRNITDEYFQSKLSQFLFSPVGAKYRLNFLFEGELECGKPAPRWVILSFLSFKDVVHEWRKLFGIHEWRKLFGIHVSPSWRFKGSSCD